MRFLRFLWSLIAGILAYLLVVAGGLTLYLIMAPLFGYLPYSDRPGPGWFGSFPAMAWNDFWSNAWEMLSFGLFIALLIALGGLLIVLPIRLSQMRHPTTTRFRVSAAVWSTLVTGYFVLGAGWYISLDLSGLIVATLLGTLTGAYVLPKARTNTVSAGA